MLAGCGNTSTQNSGSQEPYKAISFVQGGREVSIFAEDTSITLDRHRFSIRYYCKRYAYPDSMYTLQLAILPHAVDVHPGTDIETLDFFRDGSGLATNGGDTLFIDGGGHNHLYYENENSKRASLIAEKENYLYLEEPVTAFYLHDSVFPVQDIKMNELWFLAYNDYNLNQKIDAGELHKIHVTFR